MSSPKEKAEELFYKMLESGDNTHDFVYDAVAKQCALIAVDEIINVCPFIDENIRETLEQLDAYSFQFVSYWEQVKQEIEKL